MKSESKRKIETEKEDFEGSIQDELDILENLKTESEEQVHDGKYEDMEVDTSEFQKEENDSNTLSCKYCQKIFKTVESLKVHEQTHTPEKCFQICKYCNSKFPMPNRIRSHGRIQNGEKTFVCEECDEKFEPKAGLHGHEQINTGKDTTFTKLILHISIAKFFLKAHILWTGFLNF